MAKTENQNQIYSAPRYLKPARAAISSPLERAPRGMMPTGRHDKTPRAKEHSKIYSAVRCGDVGDDVNHVVCGPGDVFYY